jgi:hypothetical protein
MNFARRRNMNSLKRGRAQERIMKMNVFINCERIKNDYVVALINILKSNEFNIFTSPDNPTDCEDYKWKNWYEFELEKTINNIDIFISIITDSWESSTWMGQENSIAEKYLLNGEIQNMYFIDLRTTNFMSKGMKRYLKNELPKDYDKIINILK